MGVWITPGRNRFALPFPALILTGCGSDRTVSMTAYELLAGVCVSLIAFLFHVLHQHGAAVMELARLRGKVLRVGTITVDCEEETLTLEGWQFEGGYTGQLIAGYKPSELRDMEHAEIDRVAKRAVSEVGR